MTDEIEHTKDPEPLDHSTIEASSFIERYRQGTLSAEEEERFEAHFMDCAACQEELEIEHSFARGIKSVAAEEAVRSAVRRGLLGWLARRGIAAVLTVAALVVSGLGFGRLWRENARLESRVAELADAGELTASLAEVPVTLLGVVRGEGSAPVVDDPGVPYSLAVDVGADPRFVSYAVTLTDASGEVRYERRNLQPNVLEVLQLLVPSGFLRAGEHRLVVHGALPSGSTVEIGSHPFRVGPSG